MSNIPVFPLGRVIPTDDVKLRMEHDAPFRAFVHDSVGRYSRCDWGITDEDGRKANNYAVFHGLEIEAWYRYEADQTKINIVTEASRGATVISISIE
jgi:hypothetical protein